MKVAIVKGEDRRGNIKKALGLVEDELERAIRRKQSRTLFVKINAIDSKYPLACTSPEALETVLECLHDQFESVIVGDNTFVFAQNNHPYIGLKKRFPRVEFSDLTEFECDDIPLQLKDGRTAKGSISHLPQRAFTLSLALPKTHDTFVYTGCSKNMMGCVLKGRGEVHALKAQERLLLNRIAESNRKNRVNLARVIERAKPDFAVLDGFTGMEGDGPILGDEVRLGIAMASADCIALDIIAAKIVGFDEVPYLSVCREAGLMSSEIEMVNFGFDSLPGISRRFKPHYLYEYQIATEAPTKFPRLDVKFAFSLMKRPHRIIAKISERIVADLQR